MAGQEDSTIGELEKTVRTIYAIREMCGDLCNTTKEIIPGYFIGTVTAKVGITLCYYDVIYPKRIDLHFFGKHSKSSL